MSANIVEDVELVSVPSFRPFLALPSFVREEQEKAFQKIQQSSDFTFSTHLRWPDAPRTSLPIFPSSPEELQPVMEELRAEMESLRRPHLKLRGVKRRQLSQPKKEKKKDVSPVMSIASVPDINKLELLKEPEPVCEPVPPEENIDLELPEVAEVQAFSSIAAAEPLSDAFLPPPPPSPFLNVQVPEMRVVEEMGHLEIEERKAPPQKIFFTAPVPSPAVEDYTPKEEKKSEPKVLFHKTVLKKENKPLRPPMVSYDIHSITEKRKRKLEEVESLMESAEERTWQNLYRAGSLCAKMGDFVDAEAYYEQSLKLNRKNVEILCNLAGLYFLYSSRHREAKKLLKRARRIDPHNDIVKHNLTVIQKARQNKSWWSRLRRIF